MSGVGWKNRQRTGRSWKSGRGPGAGQEGSGWVFCESVYVAKKRPGSKQKQPRLMKKMATTIFYSAFALTVFTLDMSLSNRRLPRLRWLNQQRLGSCQHLLHNFQSKYSWECVSAQCSYWVFHCETIKWKTHVLTLVTSHIGLSCTFLTSLKRISFIN